MPRQDKELRKAYMKEWHAKNRVRAIKLMSRRILEELPRENT